MPFRRNASWEQEKYFYLLVGISIVYLLAGAWMIDGADYQAAASFKGKALSTTGIITETTTKTRVIPGGVTPSITSYNVSTVRFKTKQGKTAEFKASDICCSGRKVTVLYASDDPELAVVKGEPSPLNTARKNMGWGIFMMISGVVAAGFAISELIERFRSTRRS